MTDGKGKCGFVSCLSLDEESVFVYNEQLSMIEREEDAL